MRRERLYRVSVRELEGVKLDYFLTVDALKEEPYGISIVMTRDRDPIEEYVTMNHISADRQEICQLIEVLARGEVFPVSLAEILDDYLAKI